MYGECDTGCGLEGGPNLKGWMGEDPLKDPEDDFSITDFLKSVDENEAEETIDPETS